MNRRQFLKRVGQTVVGIAIAPAVISKTKEVKPKLTIPVCYIEPSFNCKVFGPEQGTIAVTATTVRIYPHEYEF